MTSRREFLTRAVLAAGSLTLAPRSLLATDRPTRVLIVGAGLAGLAAGWELEKAGCEVVILEAAGRAGGRIRTLRADFADGFYAEAGGDIIGSSYQTLMSFVHEFGLSVVPLSGSQARSDVLVVLGETTHRLSQLRRDPSLWPAGLSDAERRAAPFGLLGLYVGPIAREAGEPGRLLDDSFARYDRMSLRDVLIERGASEAAIRLIDVNLNYNSIRTVSALAVIRDITRRLQTVRTYGIAGGNDRLPEALAERLRHRIRYQTTLRRVEHSSAGVRLRVEQRGFTDEIAGDAAILTLPFTALREVEHSPALPEDRARMIHDLPYTQICKTFVQTRQRFWHDDHQAEAIWTDGPYERFFDISKTFAGPRGLLVGWVNGTGAEALGSTSEEQISQLTIAHLRKLFPEHATGFEAARAVHWGQTYARGAYAHYAPGQLREIAPQIARPIGRIHFAGEHTEFVAPGMEGALVSGVRAAREVLA